MTNYAKLKLSQKWGIKIKNPEKYLWKENDSRHSISSSPGFIWKTKMFHEICWGGTVNSMGINFNISIPKKTRKKRCLQKSIFLFRKTKNLAEIILNSTKNLGFHETPSQTFAKHVLNAIFPVHFVLFLKLTLSASVVTKSLILVASSRLIRSFRSSYSRSPTCRDRENSQLLRKINITSN